MDANIKLLHHLFIKSAKKHKNKLAVIDKTLNRKVTYNELLIASLMFSKKLKKYDKGFIGVLLPTSLGAIITVLGSLFSGRVPVMINYSTGADKNSKYAQDRCDFKTIITSKALLSKINCPQIEGMIFIEDILKSIKLHDKILALLNSKLSSQSLKKQTTFSDENDNAILLFTSGSEKDPKAVQLTHKNFIANYLSLKQAYSLSEKDVFLANLPLFHVFGQIAHLWIPLSEGMTIVTYANPLDYKAIVDIIRDEKATIVVGTPSFLQGYVNKSQKGDFDSCRLIISGADKTPANLHAQFNEMHSKQIYEAYGATETSPGLAVNNFEFNKIGSCGKPLPGVEFKIENYETGELCNTGEVGRILVKGDNVMKGYFDDFENNVKAFKNGWYDTGDMGYFDEEGFLWHSGRLKRFVKIGGEMVSLVKVENILESILPEDTQCCIVELPDQSKGAKIIAVTTKEVNSKEILKEMSEHLTNIALPKQFVVIEELPYMSSGKIDFRATTLLVKEKLK